jgi:hypothetical protein
MKWFAALAITVISATLAFGQPVISGNYELGLKLSYDSTTKKITGYFENYTGWDDESKAPKFSCIFYIEGTLTGKKFNIATYYPEDKKEDLINGTIQIITNKKVQIKLPEDHGGCWNVQHFADAPADFALEKQQAWIQVRYVAIAKTYFYSNRSDDTRLNAYLVKNNFVCIGKIEQGWAYCTYFGTQITKGWIKLSDLNKL